VTGLPEREAAVLWPTYVRPQVEFVRGRGVRLWDGLESLEKDYEIESTSSPRGVTHLTFTRSGL